MRALRFLWFCPRAFLPDGFPVSTLSWNVLIQRNPYEWHVLFLSSVHQREIRLNKCLFHKDMGCLRRCGIDPE